MENYIREMLQQKGVIGNVDDETLQTIIEEMQGRVLQLINRRLIDALSDSDAEQLDAMVQAGQADQTAIQTFIAEHVPNTQEITTNALVEFRNLYLAT